MPGIFTLVRASPYGLLSKALGRPLYVGVIQLECSSAGMHMTIRYPLIAIASLALALAAGAPGAGAATVIGSTDPASVTVAEEAGVVTSARVNGKRLRGAEQPRIVVLRPGKEDGSRGTVGPFAPIPVVSRDAAVHEVANLHLPVEPGDSIGLLVPAGQVDLERLFSATVEPDDDQDGLGDESQDPDLGLGGVSFDDDEGDDWFDELEEDESEEPFARRKSGQMRLLGIDKARDGDPIVKLRTPGRGVVNGTVTTSGGRWDRGIPKTIGIAGEVRSQRAGRVRLRMDLSPAGLRMLERPGDQRAVVVVSVQSTSDIKVAMRRFRQ